MDSEANSYDYRTIEQRRYLVYYKKREDEKARNLLAFSA